jgi:hypothetical protein
MACRSRRYRSSSQIKETKGVIVFMAMLTDYEKSGMSIQQAMVDHVEKNPDKASRPEHINWGGISVKTSDRIRVPMAGVITAEFLSAKGEIKQGFDLKVNGWFALVQGEHVPVLRTWRDDRFEDMVRYRYLSHDGFIWVWNVYRMEYAGNKTVDEKWTGNAGFWVESVSETETIYHCSHGACRPPDFESLVFRVKIAPNE